MKILLPVDGSADALQAVRHALALVQGGLRVSGFVLVNVQEPAALYEVVLVHDAESIEELRRSAGADLLAPAEALLDASGLPCESEVAGGDPHHTIIELAENYGCNAIVMGAQGIASGGFGSTGFGISTALGSVAEAVLAHSPVPVTVVRAQVLAEGEPG